MSRAVLPGDPPIAVQLRRSARARRYSLRVPATGGTPVLTLPQRAPEAEGLAFAASRRAWLIDQLAARPPEVIIAPGVVVPIEGTPCRIVLGQGRKVQREGDMIALPGPEARLGARLQGYLRTLARDRLSAACDHHAARLGRAYTRLDLRDTRGRWGSCSSAGRLMFSWRLVMAPPAVLDYVAAHEVAHLAQMNHGPRFWAEVARLCPGHDAQRAWLRQQGTGLHRYRFDAGAVAD